MQEHLGADARGGVEFDVREGIGRSHPVLLEAIKDYSQYHQPLARETDLRFCWK